MANIRGSVGRRGVNRRSDVVTIKYLINGHINSIRPIAPLQINGTADAKLTEAIEAFQRRIVQLQTPDGRVDPRGRTLKALNRLSASGQFFYYPEGPQEPLADIARLYIGATETSSNRMGNDPRMREIFSADYARLSRNTTDGYAWCSSFVSLCVQKLIAQSSFYNRVRPPREASVQRFLDLWAPTQKCLIFAPNDTAYDPHKGDIVVFTFSHIGIVDNVLGSSQVQTIEGNTNEAGSREGTTVRQKTRASSVIRRFIRLPVPMAYDVVNRVCIA